jgi:hypothetical protein
MYRTGGAQPGSLDSKYGPMGTCFSTGVRATVDACCKTCNDGNAMFQVSPAAIDAGCTFDRAQPCL